MSFDTFVRPLCISHIDQVNNLSYYIAHNILCTTTILYTSRLTFRLANTVVFSPIHNRYGGICI